MSVDLKGQFTQTKTKNIDWFHLYRFIDDTLISASTPIQVLLPFLWQFLLELLDSEMLLLVQIF